MGTAGVDIAFMISLMEQSYREEEEMRKEHEAGSEKPQADTAVISGDASKGAGLFKVCSKGGPSPCVSVLTFHQDTLCTMPLRRGRR